MFMTEQKASTFDKILREMQFKNKYQSDTDLQIAKGIALGMDALLQLAEAKKYEKLGDELDRKLEERNKDT